MRGVYLSADNFQYNRRFWFKLYYMMSLATTYHMPSFSSLRLVGLEKRLPVVEMGAVCLKHYTESRSPGGLEFQF